MLCIILDFWLKLWYNISYLIRKGDIMPRKSPFKIILTKEERNCLTSLTRKYTAPYKNVVRAKIILLAAEGIENKEIGEKLSLPAKTVSKWRKRFFYKRDQGLVDESRTGRPFIFFP